MREIPPAEANQILLAKNASGFTPLFNGKDLTGWKGHTTMPERAKLAPEKLADLLAPRWGGPPLIDPVPDALTDPWGDRYFFTVSTDERGRREILGIHTRGMPLGDRVDLDELARSGVGG